MITLITTTYSNHYKIPHFSRLEPSILLLYNTKKTIIWLLILKNRKHCEYCYKPLKQIISNSVLKTISNNQNGFRSIRLTWFAVNRTFKYIQTILLFFQVCWVKPISKKSRLIKWMRAVCSINHILYVETFKNWKLESM